MKSRLKSGYLLIARVIALFGFGNLRALASLRYLPRYLRQAKEFRRKGGKITHRFPILTDYSDNAGVAKGHYFHQDLLVARRIYERNPHRHIDVGSRIDGFVAHVASFRTIESVDIRPIADCGHPNIRFTQCDLMGDVIQLPNADSVSCLHAIEHFGLGRYSDTIDPDGYTRGFKGLINMVEPSGILYISFPIGRQNEVHFNAHRVFHPRDILTWPEADRLELQCFDYVDDVGDLRQNVDLLRETPTVKYGCGIYTFKKRDG